MRTNMGSLCAGLAIVVACAAWGVSFAGDDEGAFDSAEVKELAARSARLSVDDELALAKRIGRSVTAKLLTPAEAAWRKHEALRGRSDAGLARILNRGAFEGVVSPRGGGAYWSFTKRSNSYDEWPQIELQQWSFMSGFYGSNFGSVVRLSGADSVESVDLAKVPEDLKLGVAELDESRRRARGERPKAEKGGVYVVRAVMWDECDVLAAFEVVDLDAYGATIAWILLKSFDTPIRKR